MILQIIIADEIPNQDRYGNYSKLWNSNFNYMGIGACHHEGKGNMVVMTYAAYFRENEDAR
jgi:hypothetical protein